MSGQTGRKTDQSAHNNVRVLTFLIIVFITWQPFP